MLKSMNLVSDNSKYPYKKKENRKFTAIGWTEYHHGSEVAVLSPYSTGKEMEELRYDLTTLRSHSW